MLKSLRRIVHNIKYLDFFIEREGQRTSDRILYDGRMKSFIKRQTMEYMALHSVDSGISSTRYGDSEIYVSLTTHGKRIISVYRTIESLFQQTVKANKVILWLSDEEFSSDNLPEILRMQAKRGLEIRFVKDVRSYTKIVPALLEYPDATIITVDDDFIYPMDLLERLIKGHLKHPRAICSLAARTLDVRADGRLAKPYRDLIFEQLPEDKESVLFCAEGFGGVLYPPHSLHPDVTNEDLFMKLAPHTDDLWLKAMSLLNDTPVVHLHRYYDFWHEMYEDIEVQDMSLKENNLFADRNDREFDAVMSYYNLYERLKP